VASSVCDFGFDLAFCRARGVAFWLLQAERNRGAEEVSAHTLDADRLGEHRHGGLGTGEPDLVTGQGGQVLQQAAEALVELAGLVVLV
jgi:hypothetical protein